MKVGIFTDDFIHVSAHPSSSNGMIIIELDACKNVINKERVIFKKVTKRASKHSKHLAAADEVKIPANHYFEGLSENCSKMKCYNYETVMYGCNRIVARGISYALEIKLRENNVRFIGVEAKTIDEVVKKKLFENI